VEIYRICLAKYAGELVASGNPGRWNLRGQFVIYAAGSRALACLENVVHRSGEGLNSLFNVLRIEVPDDLAVEELTLAQLPPGWQPTSAYARCQPLGADWYRRQATAVLRVPSPMSTTTCSTPATLTFPAFASLAARILPSTRALRRPSRSRRKLPAPSAPASSPATRYLSSVPLFSLSFLIWPTPPLLILKRLSRPRTKRGPASC
jgi:RES domain-containing protein